MKRILFPTDFSEVATNAFIYALEFAKIVEGELVLLHTFELPVFDNQFFLLLVAAVFAIAKIELDFSKIGEAITKVLASGKDSKEEKTTTITTTETK